MIGEWTESGCYTELGNINHVGNEAKDDPSKKSGRLMRPEQATRLKILQAI